MCAVQLLRVSVHERISAAAEDFLLQLEKGEEAAELPALRALLTERLTAAAEEIVGLLEETVAEYEDRVERSEREICRQRRLLDAVLKPQVRLCRADVQQEEPRHIKEEQQEVEEPPHIKEEQEEEWSSQEADITFSPVTVKSEEEKPQSSQLHHRDSDGPEPDLDYKSSDFFVAEIEVSCDDCEATSEPPSGSNVETAVSEAGASPPDELLGCSERKEAFRKHGVLPHARGYGEKPFGCSVCGKKCSKKRDLMQHMTIHIGGRRQRSAACGARCHTCGQSLSFSECDRRLCYSHHLTRAARALPEENLFSCSVCYRKFTQRGYLTQHMARHTGTTRFHCCVCDKLFAWRRDLKNHKCGDSSEDREAETAADEDDGGRLDTDSKTSGLSLAEAAVRDSVRKESGEPQLGSHNQVPGSDVGSAADSKSFICSECGKVFCSENNLRQHMQTHAGEKPFSCSFCEKGLAQTRHLTTHKPVHIAEKRFLYCVCGKRFAWRYNLKNHECVAESSQGAEPSGCGSGLHMSYSPKIQTEVAVKDCKETRMPWSGLNCNQALQGDVSGDMADRPFSCSQCGKRFRRKKNLQEHLRIHTGEKPYGCSVCMKYFSGSGSLRKHMRIHTGEKPFSCSVCGNRFTESGHLTVHMRTHTGEKPFSCSMCGKSFRWRQSFNSHMKYHSDATRDRT